MAEGVRLYVGTQHGLSVWRARNGGWEEVSREFPDGVFDAIGASLRSGVSQRSPPTS